MICKSMIQECRPCFIALLGAVYETVLKEEYQKYFTFRQSLSSHDCLFEGVIPRVESCDCAIWRMASPVYTVSAHAAEAPNRDRKHFIKQYIEELIVEGKLDEAQKLLSKL